MNSAESVDAFYKRLEERNYPSTSRPANMSPKWPAARNDHYCNQEVCRHAVLDLSPLHILSDNDSDVESHSTPGGKVSSAQCGTMPKRYSDTGSYSSGCLRFTNKHGQANARSNHPDWVQHISRGFVEPDSLRVIHQSQLHTDEPANPFSLDPSACALRQELDDLHITNAESYVEHEEHFVGLSNSYCTLSLTYDHLAEDHDSLLHIVSKLLEELAVHSKALVVLNEWKMRTQNSFAEVRVQGQDTELLIYGTPQSRSTVDIATEQRPITAESPASRMTADKRASAVVDTDFPPMTPSNSIRQNDIHHRLILRLPPRPETKGELVQSAAGLVLNHDTRPKRVRKPTEKRKAAELLAESTEKKAKKSLR
ncbi:hypothetical protein G6011_08624 [Alternaria panax]|uniref:Uncharacterized protein n=1 Tax=Alternaria panax TaxID=48097 RepID=A0AAD4FJ45_9PLEO|nr:hypothetical protein G6011_08624 [Alternaria panax]